ncbi:polysaccharide deacetylase family protein [Dethiothermospora halolimnae]|uniref:polysaccharide deacetylase family protein n=1 Tax=Dethiothermospora halolimnae TaxID=3114390 RepID=UPI003CCBD4D7
MKIFFLKKKILYTIIIVAIAIIIMVGLLLSRDDAVETFNNQDVYYQGNTNNKVVAFTCNVDWGKEYITPMLEILKKNEIKITFFITGRWAEKNKDIVKKICQYGHEIGNHGYFHKDYSKLNYEGNKEQITKADKVMREISKGELRFFAPPSGAYNKHTIQASKDLDYKLIMWSIDTIDWRKDSTKNKIVERVIKKPHNGAIVLMHPKSETIKALPIIIKALKNKGYEIGRVSDVIE